MFEIFEQKFIYSCQKMVFWSRVSQMFSSPVCQRWVSSCFVSFPFRSSFAWSLVFRHPTSDPMVPCRTKSIIPTAQRSPSNALPRYFLRIVWITTWINRFASVESMEWHRPPGAMCKMRIVQRHKVGFPCCYFYETPM